MFTPGRLIGRYTCDWTRVACSGYLELRVRNNILSSLLENGQGIKNWGSKNTHKEYTVHGTEASGDDQGRSRGVLSNNDRHEKKQLRGGQER